MAERTRVPLIVFFTDFGSDGPYVGQMRLAVGRIAPVTAVVNLLHDAPRFDPKASAYLLAALTPRLPPTCTCVGVVDPGVGGVRAGVIVEADGRFFVGPGNGLFEIVRRRAGISAARVWILPEDSMASASFHGRDIFAPIAARLTLGAEPAELAAREASSEELPGADWPDDLPEIIYLDHYGNAMTGIRGAQVAPDATLRVAGVTCRHARTFSDVPKGEAFWYENSIGLAEIAVNGGSALDALSLAVGSPIEVA